MSFIESWRNGQVVRKHTMENIRAENIGEHTWGVVTLLLMAWPGVKPNIVVGAQFHDSGERATGDMPGPTKWANPVLESEMDRLEHEHIQRTLPEHLRDDITTLTENEWAVIEIFDRAEFCISMGRERRLVNTYAMIYFERALTKMEQVIETHLDAFEKMDPELVVGIRQLHREIIREQQECNAL